MSVSRNAPTTTRITLRPFTPELETGLESLATFLRQKAGPPQLGEDCMDVRPAALAPRKPIWTPDGRPAPGAEREAARDLLTHLEAFRSRWGTAAHSVWGGTAEFTVEALLGRLRLEPGLRPQLALPLEHHQTLLNVAIHTHPAHAQVLYWVTCALTGRIPYPEVLRSGAKEWHRDTIPETVESLAERCREAIADDRDLLPDSLRSIVHFVGSSAWTGRDTVDRLRGIARALREGEPGQVLHRAERDLAVTCEVRPFIGKVRALYEFGLGIAGGTTSPESLRASWLEACA